MKDKLSTMPKPFIYGFFAILFLVVLVTQLISFDVITLKFTVTLLLSFFSIILIIQSLFTLTWMLYAWEDPKNAKSHRSPDRYLNPKHSFTALIPTRFEKKVIKDTISAVNNIDYPTNLKEIVVLCRKDDSETMEVVKETIQKLQNKNIKLVVYNSFPINKPHALNYGLKNATNEVVAVFDAEDQPNKEIYNIVNTLLVKDKVDFVQSGVQLINYRSPWFSILNVMEYFFWFKSGLHFFSRIGKIMPLGGNTVFIKKLWLEKVNGWDENCLTEDADMGIRLVTAGARPRVVYDEKHATHEETPHNINSFIKQRTRWNQGFLQILLKGDWKKLPKMRQKLTALYILTSPEMQSLMFLYVPFSILIAFSMKLSLLVSLFSFIPLNLFVLQLIVNLVGMYEFKKGLNAKRLNFWIPIKAILTFYPYQFMLMISSFRAIYRVSFNNLSWEKTFHTNIHREIIL